MANNRDLAQLMLDAYNAERIGFDNFKKYGAGIDHPNGLRIQAYLNEATKEVIIGIAGTNDLQDIRGPNADFPLGGYDGQFREALEYAYKVSKELGDTNGGNPNGYTFSVTGHSLGGGISQMLSHTFGWSGATFDAPAASGIIQSPAYHAHLHELGLTAQGADRLTNYTESGSLVSNVPARSYIGEQISVNLTPNDALYIGGVQLLAPNPMGWLGSGIFLANAQWGSNGQHSAEKFAHFFSHPQSANEIDGWHYVGGTYDGWYNTAPNPVLGQFDWARRASIPTAGQKRHGLPT